jgi:hypothetical protein
VRDQVLTLAAIFLLFFFVSVVERHFDVLWSNPCAGSYGLSPVKLLGQIHSSTHPC